MGFKHWYFSFCMLIVTKEVFAFECNDICKRTTSRTGSTITVECKVGYNYNETKEVYNCTRSLFGAKTEKNVNSCSSSRRRHRCQILHILRIINTAVLEDNFFEGLTLSQLSLIQINTTSLSEQIFHGVKNLAGLELLQGKLTCLPASIRSLDNLKGLKATGQNLEAVPDFSFQGMKFLLVLDLSNNSISNIGRDAFVGLSSLGKLRLHKNNLTSVPTEALKRLLSLSNLELGENRISELKSEAFAGINVTKIGLRGNEIEKVPLNVFAGLGSLIDLDLSNNLLTWISNSVFGEKSNITYLNLSNNYITELTENNFFGTIVTTLDLDNNHISVVDSNAFARLEGSLRYLYLGHNKLRRIPHEALQNLTELRTVSLKDNLIEYIEPDTFQGFGISIKEIDLTNNRLSSFFEIAFNHLPNAVNLHLEGNPFDKMNVQMIQMENEDGIQDLELVIKNTNASQFQTLCSNVFLKMFDVKILSIHGDTLIEIPDSVKRLTKLFALKITGQNLTTLQKNSFTGMKSLEHLLLNSNLIFDINQNAFVGLDRLTYLNLASNNLTSIPRDAFGNFSRLKRLDLEDNNISELRENDFLELTSLTWLNLRQNKILSIHEKAFQSIENFGLNNPALGCTGWGCTSRIHIKNPRNRLFLNLSLSNNPLSSIPSDAIRNLSKLVELDLQACNITELKEHAFAKLPNLQTLLLQDNRISSVHPEAFNGSYVSLNILMLAGNMLHKVPTNALSQLRNLTRVSFGSLIEYVEPHAFTEFGENLTSIDLSGNRITSISEYAFDLLPNLKELILSNNLLTRLEFTVFQPLIKQLEYLVVSGNPLECCCELFWYYKFNFKNLSNYNTTWFFEHQRKYGLELGQCKNNKTIIKLEEDCNLGLKSMQRVLEFLLAAINSLGYLF